MVGPKHIFKTSQLHENKPASNRIFCFSPSVLICFVSNFRLKKPRPSKVSISEFSEKIDRYKDAVSKFKKGQIITISEMLTQAKQMRNFRQCKGVVVSILNENFGLVEVKGFFALFDTFDLYLSHGTTAAESNKGIYL